MESRERLRFSRALENREKSRAALASAMQDQSKNIDNKNRLRRVLIFSLIALAGFYFVKTGSRKRSQVPNLVQAAKNLANYKKILEALSPEAGKPMLLGAQQKKKIEPKKESLFVKSEIPPHLLKELERKTKAPPGRDSYSEPTAKQKGKVVQEKTNSKPGSYRLATAQERARALTPIAVKPAEEDKYLWKGEIPARLARDLREFPDRR